MTDRETVDPEIREPQPHRGSRRTGVVAVALVGLALAAGVTYLASTLVSQPIGLTSEPATVGDSLAPGTPSSAQGTTSTSTSTRPAVTTVTTTVVTPPLQTGTQPTVTSPPGGGDADHDDD